MSLAQRVAARFLFAMIPAPVLRVAKKVSGFLRENGVDHAIAGGMAVSMHGHPRMTEDVDILVSADAASVIRKLGKTAPISGHLDGISVKVDGIDVDFVFAAKGLTSKDITSAKKAANGLPVVGVEPLILMKLGAGRSQDVADVIALLKLGKVPVAKVEKRLDKQEREDFTQLIQIAELEKKGDTKKAGRLFMAALRRRSTS